VNKTEGPKILLIKK